ncbi:hypothetical protein P308_06785 [Pseudomonas piscis]|nr:hypothetical protein P308_06785 [Pseudomonas piscis]
MLGTDCKSPRCIALEGEVGKGVSCSIYAQRGSPCREFEASWIDGQHNADCDAARAAFGLAPLEPANDEPGTRKALSTIGDNPHKQIIRAKVPPPIAATECLLYCKHSLALIRRRQTTKKDMGTLWIGWVCISLPSFRIAGRWSSIAPTIRF